MGGGGLGGLGRGQYRPTGHILGGGGCGEVSGVEWSGVEWSGATLGVRERSGAAGVEGAAWAYQYQEGRSE